MREQWVGWMGRGIVAASLVLGVTLTAAASGGAPDKQNESGIAVVAHVPLNGEPADQLFVREGPKNQILLYVVHQSGQEISVVDITQPAKAALVRGVGAAPPAMAGRPVPVGTNTLIVENETSPAAEAPPRPKTIRLFDLSDPTMPRLALQFDQVSIYTLDESRSLIYLVNREGLWIVRHVEPPDWKTKAWMEFASTP